MMGVQGSPKDSNQSMRLFGDTTVTRQSWQKLGVEVETSPCVVTTYNTLAGHQPQFHGAMQGGTGQPPYQTAALSAPTWGQWGQHWRGAAPTC